MNLQGVLHFLVTIKELMLYDKYYIYYYIDITNDSTDCERTNH